ncbi:MAG: NUDIX domain-containing protein [Flavobacteriales bacterium]|nr:NUDIX domain-containing protein [Flavobacteriales bacterium]
MQKGKQAEIRFNPNVSVDCVIFGFDGERLKVLLIDRGQEINGKDSEEKIYVLPGNLIREDENLNDAAERVLDELTGLSDIFLEQFGSFGAPDRLTKEHDLAWLKSIRAEPEARVITVAYYSLIRADQYEIHASGFAKEAFWYDIDDMPKLGFDHQDIIEQALTQLKFKSKYQPLGFELLPEKFTLGQLQKLYEAILKTELDKRNFRRKILKMSFLVPLKEKQQGVPHKPARYYTFDHDMYHRYKSNDFYFTL